MSSKSYPSFRSLQHHLYENCRFNFQAWFPGTQASIDKSKNPQGQTIQWKSSMPEILRGGNSSMPEFYSPWTRFIWKNVPERR